MRKEYKIAFLVMLYFIESIKPFVENKKTTLITKQIIEKLQEIYAIEDSKIKKLDGTKKNLNSLNIETDALMHNEGTLQILESIRFELLQTKEFEWLKILDYLKIKTNNLKNEALITFDLKMLGTTKNMIHAATNLFNKADVALSEKLDEANKDLTNLIDKANTTLTDKLNETKTEFEHLIEKSEKTIKSIIWNSQHALTYIVLTIFCAKILFNEYLFFKQKKNKEYFSKKDLFFSFLMVSLGSGGLIYSLQELNKNKVNY